MFRIRDLSFQYPDTNTFALSNVNLDFSEGEFVILCGRNGGGKSTLLKTLLGIVPEFTGGTITGIVSFKGNDIRNLRVVDLAGQIGILLQDPDAQITNLTCFEEVAFGLENMCLTPEVITQDAEHSLANVHLASYRDHPTYQLSGGQAQRLSLAALFAMQPSVLVMDEPLANLDPQGSRMVVETLQQLKNRVGLTIVSSHMIEPFLKLATRVVVLDKGQVVLDFPISNLASYKEELTKYAVYMPSTAEMECLIQTADSPALVTMQKVGYRYPEGDIALRNITCSILSGQRVLIMGPNGGGKSTFARLVVGLRRPTSGKIMSEAKRPWYVHQNPTVGFLTPSVKEEVGYGHQNAKEVKRLLEYFGLTRYSAQSPFSLSGGEQRLVSLATAFAARPDLLVLDEPTAGLDAEFVQKMLTATADYHETIIHITHDPRVIATHPSQVFQIESGHIREVPNATRL